MIDQGDLRELEKDVSGTRGTVEEVMKSRSRWRSRSRSTSSSEESRHLIQQHGTGCSRVMKEHNRSQQPIYK